MTPAIRIIKAPQATTANMLLLEKEKHFLAVAEKVAEASGHITPERVDSCIDKLREVSTRFNSKSPAQLASEISKHMTSPAGASALMAHADLDYERILELLEG